MTLEQFEQDLKKYLFPYNTFLKVSKIGDYTDNEQMIEDNRPVEEFNWNALNSECNYPDL